MDGGEISANIAINILSSFLYDLLKRVKGGRPSQVEMAVARTVEAFPAIEGLKQTLEEWMTSPGIIGILEDFSKGLKGFDPIRVEALTRILTQATGFFLAEDTEQVGREVLYRFFQELRDQYLQAPETGIPHVANRVEENIAISRVSLGLLQVTAERMAGSEPASTVDAEIDEVRDCIDRREYDLARRLSGRIRQRNWHSMNPRQKFRVLSNLAAVELQEERLREAAKLFIEAKEQQPDDAVANANEALAYFLVGERERAFDLASAAKTRFSTSGRALMVWLDSAPKSTTLDQLRSAIPPLLSDDPEVVMALARRALALKDTAEAEGLCRNGAKLKPDWPYPWVLLGETIFRSLLPDTPEDYGTPEVLNEAQLSEANKACDKAIELAKTAHQPSVEAAALLIRGEIRKLLGDSNADEDVIRAYLLCPNDATVSRDYAHMKFRSGQKAEAIEVLRKFEAEQDRPDLRGLLALVLSATDKPQDRVDATTIFRSMANDAEKVPLELRRHAAIAAVDNYVRDNNWQEAAAFISQLPATSVSPAIVLILRSRIESKAANSDRAAELAIEAASSLDGNQFEVRLTAQLLAELGRHRDALPLWQSLALPIRAGHDAYRLLDCAFRLGEHGIFLSACEQLRATGVYDPQIIEAEAGIRAEYDTEGTVKLLAEHLRRHPGDRSARLQLSVLGIQLGRDNLVSSDPSMMPAFESIAPQNWRTIILVIKHGGRAWEALRLAYGLLRSNFSNVEAHRAYFAALLPGEGEPVLSQPETAGPGTAVAFSEEGDSQIEWRVIEEDFESNAALQEIGPTHFIANQLSGKRTGDSFLLTEGSVVPRRAKLVQVLNKYAYRYLECGQNWMRRFPDQPDIQPVRIPVTGSGQTEQFDFTEFFQSFDRLLARKQEALEAYRIGLLPTHILAVALGRNDFEQFIQVATDDSLTVKCCVGRVEERSTAVEAVGNASKIVLEITALATLTLLDSFEVLSTLPAKLVVAEGVLLELRELLKEYSGNGEKKSMDRSGFRYVITEMGPDVVRSHREFLESVIGKVETHCTVVPGRDLAAMSRERRELLKKAAGEHGAQSIALALAPGTVLWTDDMVVGILAAHEFGVRRAWTQVVFEERVRAGAIKPEAFNEATAKLLGCRYYFTSASLPALVRAGELAMWNPDRWPLKGALEVFRDRNISTRDILMLATGFVVQINGQVVLPQLRDVLTISVLERLVSRAEGFQVVGPLLRMLRAAFGLNVLRASEVLGIMHAWLASKRGFQTGQDV